MHRCEGFGVSVDSKLYLNAAKRIVRVYWRRGKRHLGSAREVHLGGAPDQGDNIQREAVRKVTKLSARIEGFKDRLHRGGKALDQRRTHAWGGLLYDEGDNPVSSVNGSIADWYTWQLWLPRVTRDSDILGSDLSRATCWSGPW